MGLNILSKGRSETAEYKAGYDAAEKRYKHLEKERDIALAQIKKLGYELGEKPDPLRAAIMIKKHCKSHINCEGCEFQSPSGCVLNGDNPSLWMVI